MRYVISRSRAWRWRQGALAIFWWLYKVVLKPLCRQTFFTLQKKRERRKGAGGGGEKEGSESILYNVLGVIPPVNTKTCFTGIWVAGAWFMWIWASVLCDMHRKHHENICSKCVNFRAVVKFLLGLTIDFSDLGTWIHFLIFLSHASVITITRWFFYV